VVETPNNEIWAYDEPHPSGGNAHITMTRKQAVEWMRLIYSNVYDANDNQAFEEWKAVNWAYREKESD
jgi:ferric-dicitrate binding protein FerR (iron transport regulator)